MPCLVYLDWDCTPVDTTVNTRELVLMEINIRFMFSDSPQGNDIKPNHNLIQINTLVFSHIAFDSPSTIVHVKTNLNFYLDISYIFRNGKISFYYEIEVTRYETFVIIFLFFKQVSFFSLLKHNCQFYTFLAFLIFKKIFLSSLEHLSYLFENIL